MSQHTPSPAGPLPPQARQIPKELSIHGDTRVDPYYWLRGRDNPEVLDYLKAENEYTQAVMKHTVPLQEELYKEMLGRIKQTDLSVPERIGDYFYYSRTEEGKQYPIYCRKPGSLEGKEEILLDGNKEAEGKKYFRLGNFEPSPDHKRLAFSVDFEGDETYILRVKDLESGQLLPGEIPNTYYSLAWAEDNQHLFYTTLDAAMRPDKVFRHQVGEDPAKDSLIFHEADEKFFLSVSKTRSRRFITIRHASQVTTEVRFLHAGRPLGEFQVFRPREYEVEYQLDHHGDSFYFLLNKDAKNFRLLRTPVKNWEEGQWEEILPHRPEVKLDGIDLFANHLVIHAREDGLKSIWIRNLETEVEHKVAFPEPVYSYWKSENPEFATDLLRFRYTSLVTPMSVFDYDMNSRERELKKQTEVLGGYDPSAYASERIFARAEDGVRIPLSVVYRKDLKKEGAQPCLLYGYGSYGSSMDPYFSSHRLSLLDRGMIFAIAHIRGGGEMGRMWYEDGKRLKKRNTFTDFIAAAEHLVGEKYTAPGQLAIMGGSAGGLLMGAVTNLRPDLFQAVVAQVPFVDVVTTMLDPTIPLTVIEYDEWGNPNEPEYYEYMKSYSPYDNVERKDYPHILITAGLNDPRVQYWEPAKWCARLREKKTSGNRLLLKTNMGAGHGGASGRYDALKETAFDYAFILDLVGDPDSD